MVYLKVKFIEYVSPHRICKSVRVMSTVETVLQLPPTHLTGKENRHLFSSHFLSASPHLIYVASVHSKTTLSIVNASYWEWTARATKLTSVLYRKRK